MASEAMAVNYLDGEGWQPCTRERASRILINFCPDLHALNARLDRGEVVTIHFGGFQAAFCLATVAHDRETAQRAALRRFSGRRRRAA